jgi:hypothetical protein
MMLEVRPTRVIVFRVPAFENNLAGQGEEVRHPQVKILQW